MAGFYMEQNRKILALEWIERAEDDELNILSVLKHRDGTPAFVCFASQQVVEKCLKALLLFYSGDHPKEHSLSKLTSLLEVYCPGISEKIKSEIISLDPYYIGTRYPGDIPLESFTWKLSEEAYKSAVKIKTLVLEKINKNQKGFIAPIVLTVVIVAAILGVAGFAAYKYFIPKQRAITTTSISDKTIGWKTFRNDKYGFEFSYPANLDLDDAFEGSGDDYEGRMLGITFLSNEQNILDKTFAMSVGSPKEVCRNPEYLNPQSKMNALGKTDAELFLDDNKKFVKEINYYCMEEEVCSYNLNYRIKNNNDNICAFMAFRLSYLKQDEDIIDKENEIKIFQEIFSTFKFIPVK